MGLYFSIARRSFRRYSTYRVATAAGLFTNTVFGLVMCYTYIALWDARPGLGGYDVDDAVTYVWLGQSLGVVCALWGGGFREELARRIRSGDVAIDLYRPVDIQTWWFASDLGRVAFHLLARGIGPTLVGGLLFSITLPPSPLSWAAFFLAVVLAAVVSFSINYLFVLTAFWLMDDRGVQQLSGILALFFSGLLLPLNIFPGLLGDIAMVLPWASALQVPADIFLGKHQGLELLSALGFQAGWAVLLWIAGRALTEVATRRVVVQGG